MQSLCVDSEEVRHDVHKEPPDPAQNPEPHHSVGSRRRTFRTAGTNGTVSILFSTAGAVDRFILKRFWVVDRFILKRFWVCRPLHSEAVLDVYTACFSSRSEPLVKQAVYDWPSARLRALPPIPCRTG